MTTEKSTQNLLFVENNDTIDGIPKPNKETSEPLLAIEMQPSGSTQTNPTPTKNATLDKSQLKRGYESPRALIQALNEKSRSDGPPMKKERRSEKEENHEKSVLKVKPEKTKSNKFKKDVSSKNPSIKNEETLKKPRNAFLLFCEDEKQKMKNDIMQKKIQAAEEAGKSAEKEKLPSASEIASKLSEIWNEHKETKSVKFVHYSELYSKNLAEYKSKKNDTNESEYPRKMKELESENQDLKKKLETTIKEKNVLEIEMEKKSEALEKSQELVKKLLKENEELISTKSKIGKESRAMDERRDLMNFEDTCDDMDDSTVQRKLAIENSSMMCEDNSSPVLQKDSVVDDVEQCRTECTKQSSNVPVCNLNKLLFEVAASLPNPTTIPQPSADDLVKPQADIETGSDIVGTVSDKKGIQLTAISDECKNGANMSDTMPDSSQKEQVDNKFMAQTGDLVLVKLGTMRSWPAKIKSIENGVFSVQFYGDLKTAQCGIEDIKLLTNEELANLKKATKGKGKGISLLKKAILQVESHPNVV